MRVVTTSCMGFQQLGITSLLISCSSKNADRGAFKLQGCFETKFKHWGKSFESRQDASFIYALKFSLPDLQ